MFLNGTQNALGDLLSRRILTEGRQTGNQTLKAKLLFPVVGLLMNPVGAKNDYVSRLEAQTNGFVGGVGKEAERYATNRH